MGALFALIFVSAPELRAQRTSRLHDKVQEISAADAEQRWLKFASSGMDGNFRMGFKIKHSPRRGESSLYSGEICGMSFGGSERIRVSVKIPDSNSSGGSAEFLLINSPLKKEVWKFCDGVLEKISEDKWHDAILENLIISPFDLLMPYKNWRASYEGAGRLGQAVYFYALKPEKIFLGSVEKIEIALTREFNSPAQVVSYMKNNPDVPARTLTLGAVKKIEGFWTVLEFDVRDESTRDKDTLRFISAKMRAEFSKDIFEVENLGKPMKNLPLMESL